MTTVRLSYEADPTGTDERVLVSRVLHADGEQHSYACGILRLDTLIATLAQRGKPDLAVWSDRQLNEWREALFAETPPIGSGTYRVRSLRIAAIERELEARAKGPRA